ncbi:MAG: glycosyltransferase [Verrucomicrobia bacterium]|nr:glycosyltransferase [Verrucomicrobiota bacterium]
MRLVHVVPSLAEQHGGPSRSVRALCRALAEQGHDVELLATDPAAAATGETSQEGPLRIRVFRRDWPGRVCPSRGLARALREASADVVHHHSLWLRTLHYAHRASPCLVISPRGMMSAWAWHHRPWRKRLARWFVHPGALASARGWHATSAEEAAEIRGLGFTAPVCVAPNGVAAPPPADSADARAHWFGVCPETARRPVALFYSRLHRKKRVLELIDLWLARGPADWLLLIAGIPEDYQPRDLERYVQRNSGAGRIRIFDSLTRPPPYAVASLFLLPSHSENFGLVVAEAMAHGVPALVTDTTPWKEMARLELGWCVPWTDFGTALAQAVGENPEALRARGTRAREWALREFSWSHSARLLAALYQRLLAPSP